MVDETLKKLERKKLDLLTKIYEIKQDYGIS
jgi:hypothetical protein